MLALQIRSPGAKRDKKVRPRRVGVEEFLAGKRNLIRSCGNIIGLGRDWYRCAVRSPAECHIN